VKGDKHFNSRFEDLGPFATDVGNHRIKDEPMFFNSSVAYAYEQGGPITRAFLELLPEEYQIPGAAVFDSRVHMLMPGWFPAIPGFHHDDVPRPEVPVGQHFITAGQPDYDNPRYRSEHIFGLVNAQVAPTEFAVGECVMPEVAEGDLIYRRWHNEVERLIETGDMQRVQCSDRRLIRFDCDAFHQGTEAVGNGWRWFGRASVNTERAGKVTNEIRQQAQVYMRFPMEGW